MLNSLQKRLLNTYQHDFPLSPTPYQDMADTLGVSEKEILSALAELSEQNCISRIGPIITPNRIGVSTLVAMTVPPELLQTIAGTISAFQEVNHNYEREHVFNLWFVVVAANQTQLQKVIAEIEVQTGINTLQLPLIEEYHIDLGFELDLNIDNNS